MQRELHVTHVGADADVNVICVPMGDHAPRRRAVARRILDAKTQLSLFRFDDGWWRLEHGTARPGGIGLLKLHPNKVAAYP